MNLLYYFIIISLFSGILTLDPIPHGELGEGISIIIHPDNMINNEYYAFAKNVISGVFTFDIESPVLLNLSYGQSDTIATLPSSFDEGHNENITQWKNKEGFGYFYSFSVFISNDNKYTVLKLKCPGDEACLTEGKKIKIALITDYTWKISIFVLFLFLFFIGVIFATSYFARNCLSKCCNFRKNETHINK